MGLKEDLQDDVADIFKTRWSTRDGYVVPLTDSVKMGNDAVILKEAVVLYADLAASTQLVNTRESWFAAEVYKAYLRCASKIIRSHQGEITAFDGDRVMAVYLGDRKNSNATLTALKIAYAVERIINPAIAKQFSNANYKVRQVVGIDRSALFIARTGIRGSNDLVWVGRAANYAAKLCAIREEDYTSYITADVYKMLSTDVKVSSVNESQMWEKRFWKERGIDIYCFKWQQEF